MSDDFFIYSFHSYCDRLTYLLKDYLTLRFYFSVTGFPLWLSTVLTGLVCTFYTTVVSY